MSEKKHEEVQSLWIEYAQSHDPKVKEQLILKYLPLVKIISGRLAMGLPHYVDKDDLLSCGFFGLLDAVERYDPGKGVKFETYASLRIRGAILDALRAQDWIPSSLRQQAKQFEIAVGRLEHRLGRSASDEEIAAELGLNMPEYYALLTKLNTTAIIPLEDFAENEQPQLYSSNPLQSIEDNDVKNTLMRSIERLPEKERTIVGLYYYEGLTLKEISLVFGLSEARISQLHTKAIYRLRGALLRLKSSLL